MELFIYLLLVLGIALKSSLQTRIFMCGVYASSGLTMAHQDWYGLEGYITYVNKGWVELHWGVGLTIALVAIGIFIQTYVSIERTRPK